MVPLSMVPANPQTLLSADTAARGNHEIDRVKNLMSSKSLRLNDDKTQFL